MKKSITTYEVEIRELHAELIDYPDSKTLHNRLSARLGKWQAMLEITVLAANNEQKPWTTEEIGLQTKPMHLKSISGFDQVGDYQFFIGGAINQWGGLLIERKTVEDSYGTLMNREQRSRFYREVLRYEQDDRFNQFHLIAECTYGEFLNYVPSIFVFTADSAPETMRKNIIQYLQRFYKIKVLAHQINRPHYDTIAVMTADHQIFINLVAGGAEVFIDGVLRETLVPIKSYQNKIQYFIRRGATEVSKIETINSLENKIQVSFVGSRARAVEKYPGLIRQWCIKNYAKILNLEVVK